MQQHLSARVAAERAWRRVMRAAALVVPLAIAAVAVAGFPATAAAASAVGPGGPGAVYTMTNSPAGNAVEAFDRHPDGSLTPAGVVPTGGNGGTLGSGHSVVVSDDGRTVLAVNAGSNSFSVFDVFPQDLRLVAVVGSEGTGPNSVTIHGNLIYVLNAGSNTIAGFRLLGFRAVPIPGTLRPLNAGAVTARQIQFDPSGRVLVVDEGGSSTIDTFLVNGLGVEGPAVTTPSTGGGPFGFDFDRAGHLLISDAALGTGMSGATSYDLSRGGVPIPNGPAVSSGQAAACWLAAAGHFAYTDNAGSGTVGRYAVGPDGGLTLLGNTPVAGSSASHPLDMDASRQQDYLYVLANGLSTIVGYRVGGDGSLTQVTEVAVAATSGGIAAI